MDNNFLELNRTDIQILCEKFIRKNLDWLELSWLEVNSQTLKFSNWINYRGVKYRGQPIKNQHILRCDCHYKLGVYPCYLLLKYFPKEAVFEIYSPVFPNN